MKRKNQSPDSYDWVQFPLKDGLVDLHKVAGHIGEPLELVQDVVDQYSQTHRQPRTTTIARYIVDLLWFSNDARFNDRARFRRTLLKNFPELNDTEVERILNTYSSYAEYSATEVHRKDLSRAEFFKQKVEELRKKREEQKEQEKQEEKEEPKEPDPPPPDPTVELEITSNGKISMEIDLDTLEVTGSVTGGSAHSFRLGQELLKLVQNHLDKPSETPRERRLKARTLRAV